MTSSPDARHSDRLQTTLWLAGGLAITRQREVRTLYPANRFHPGT